MMSRTARFRHPWVTLALSTSFISAGMAEGRVARGTKPMSCMRSVPTTNTPTRRPDRTTNGTARSMVARSPPTTAPPTSAVPDTMAPRAKTGSSSPSYPLAASASTTHASTAPE
jgi:hypothetical protein